MMGRQTTPEQRLQFYRQHLGGMTYPDIAHDSGFSPECVRYWCRRQRSGGSCYTVHPQRPAASLSRFDSRIRDFITRLRQEHPRWGPDALRAEMDGPSTLKGLALPSRASIGRFLKQLSGPDRPPRRRRVSQRPKTPLRAQQRWEIDFKLDIRLDDGTRCNLFGVRDPVGAVCIGAYLLPAHKQRVRGSKVTAEETRAILRRCFSHWHTLPEEVQTDGELVLVGKPDSFPTMFTLWLTGLGIKHVVTRPRRPTDNAEVERCHQTLMNYVIIGQEHKSLEDLQALLSQAVQRLAAELPSRAKDCAGRPPLVAHPELLQPRRPFAPEHELAEFDLQRVDAFLASQTWYRLVGQDGRVSLTGRNRHYMVGRAYAQHYVQIRFRPADRHFVFYDMAAPDQEIARRAARYLEVADITGLAEWPAGLGTQQLPLPLFLEEGVDC